MGFLSKPKSNIYLTLVGVKWMNMGLSSMFTLFRENNCMSYSVFKRSPKSKFVGLSLSYKYLGIYFRHVVFILSKFVKA